MSGFGTQPRKRKRSVARLRHFVTVQHRVQTGEDDRGQPIDSWQTLIPRMPCHIEKLSGSEAEVARQLVETATHRVEARFDSRVTNKMRLVLTIFSRTPRYFYIGDVTDVEEVGRFMNIIVEEKKA